MGSIRPLITITILAVVFAYLYRKINEGPVGASPVSHGTSDNSPDGVPPLAAAGGAKLAQGSAAPAWPPAGSTSATAAPNVVASPATPTTATNAAPAAPAINTAASDSAKNTLPVVPPIPELPEIPKAADATSQAAAPTPPLPTDLPKNIPEARYGDEAGPKVGAGASAGTASAPLVLPTNSIGAAENSLATNPAVPGPTSGSNSTNLADTPSATAPAAVPPADRYGTTTTPAAQTPASLTPVAPAASPPNALRSGTPTNPVNPQRADRYGLSGNSTSPPESITPTAQPSAAGATFAASWPAIQAALDQHDLKKAHQLLSKWHSDETLAPADAQKVETLLGQLAGTVIYSTEHRLEPPRVVKPGETLETIAKEYNVPWQLLAKINSIPAPDQVRAGQELKVVRGPFSAVVDLRRSELTLEVDGRYAGTFPVAVVPGTTVAEGQWLVDQKLVGTQTPGTATAAASAAVADRSIVLRNGASPGGPPNGPTLTIASNPPAGANPGAAAIRVAPQDAEDLSDILSIGSRVSVRR
jgi:LysM repeat protein